MRVRHALKVSFEAALISSRVDALGRKLRSSRYVILAYHNIVPDLSPPSGDQSLHLPLSRFREQLDFLSTAGRVVSLGEFLAGPSRDDGTTSTRFVITFDDAYRGAVELGLMELRERGLPATIFVAPGLLGDRTLWWDALSAVPEGFNFAKVREELLRAGKGTEAEATGLLREMGVEVPDMEPVRRTASQSELRRALEAPGISVGAHSWSHPALARLQEKELYQQLKSSRDWLSSRHSDRYVDCIAYPYGIMSAAVHDAARKVGFAAGFSLAGKSIAAPGLVSGRSAFETPRINIPAGLSINGFRLTLAWR